MAKIILDVETRSECNIWSTGAWVYSTHPSTQVLCAGYAVDNGPIQLLTDNFEPLYALLRDEQNYFYAFNAFFERVIWKNVLEKKHGAPPAPLMRWRCIQAKACAYGLPKSLDKAADAMNCSNQKDRQGKQIMRLMSKPRWKDGKAVFNEKAENYDKLYRYCEQDVATERELDSLLPELSPKEQEVWFYDQLINERGTRVDIDSVKNIIHLLENRTRTLNKELVDITEGQVTKGTQVPSMQKFLNDTGCDIPNLRKETVTEYIKAGKINPTQMRVLRLRQQLGKTSTKKYRSLLEATDNDNILRDNYVYHAANTGRWGGQIVQLQNLTYDKTGDIDPERAIERINRYDIGVLEMMYPGRILDVISKAVRGVFIPGPGKELYVVDYGAIEARVLMWLAGEARGLTEFRATDAGTDEDIYVKMAQRIYHNDSLTKKSNPQERALGKATILGAGYGMGGTKFSYTCSSWGIPIDEERGKRIINLYRNTYAHIPKFWHLLEHAALSAFQNPGRIFTAGSIGYAYQGDLYCRLPSGRLLTYPQPGLVDNRFGGKSLSYMTEVTKQWVRKETFGGGLAENCLARDTKVVTMRGLVPIAKITKKDKLWDGGKWITHNGVISQGKRKVIKRGGLVGTPDHEILVGNSWKPLIDLGGKVLVTALKKGWSLAPLRLYQVVKASKVKHYADASAVQKSITKLENYIDTLSQNVFPAHIKQEEKSKKSIATSCKEIFSIRGFIDTRGWFPGAIILLQRLIKIMGLGALKCTENGLKIVNYFWNTLKLCLVGTNLIWIWIELITKKTMCQVISVYVAEKEILETNGTQDYCSIKGRNIATWIFGKYIVLNGKAIMQLRGTLKREGRQKKSSNTIEKQEVYDILNCGPHNRFMVITKHGPLLVHNCTQAVARDIMAYSFPRLEKAGFPILMHTHDEIVSEQEKGAGRIDEMIQLMCQGEDWSGGCPIVAEGFTCDRYKKG